MEQSPPSHIAWKSRFKPFSTCREGKVNTMMPESDEDAKDAVDLRHKLKNVQDACLVAVFSASGSAMLEKLSRFLPLPSAVDLLIATSFLHWEALLHLPRSSASGCFFKPSEISGYSSFLLPCKLYNPQVTTSATACEKHDGP